MRKNNHPNQTIILSKKLFEQVVYYRSNDNINSIHEINQLLDQGTSITEIAYYESPLSYAARMNFVEVIQLFMDKGMDINTTFLGLWKIRNGSEVGYAATILHFAAEYGFFDMAEFLLLNNAKFICDYRSKISPLHIAIGKNFLDLIKLFIKNEADLLECNHIYQQNAYQWAEYGGNTEIISYFKQVKIGGEMINITDDGL